MEMTKAGKMYTTYRKNTNNKVTIEISSEQKRIRELERQAVGAMQYSTDQVFYLL